ncbi:MAG: amidase [bacterium]|nr:amidase [bacterium]
MLKYWKLSGLVVLAAAVGFVAGRAQDNKTTVQISHVSAAEKIIGLEFTTVEKDSMLDDLNENLENYQKVRTVYVGNDVPMALQFNPIPVGWNPDRSQRIVVLSEPERTERPDDLNDLAFYSVTELAGLIRSRKVTSVELTRMYIGRLKKYGPQLECVVTLTEPRAMERAQRADQEIEDGNYRGPLHGIPFGAKDLLAVRGYPTTWGAVPYEGQVLEVDAEVIKRLDDAGAVLVAKLTLGALAWGDVWFGGKTRNPWNLEQGSSGSSAGSASATSAGLVAFAIGTETWGSIVSPATRCGVTGLRPTYGRVSRTGAMALSWSMDKIGPICRTVEDCAVVFQAIAGPDGVDQTLIDLPFNYDARVPVGELRVGYTKSLFEADYGNRKADAATLERLREQGVKLVPIELPDFPIEALSYILTAEAAAAFDDLTRSGRDDLMVRQIKGAWPNVFRSSRLIPAVEYIQANRIRHMLVQDMQRVMADIDVYVVPSFGGNNLLMTNLTGHPCVVLPNGFNEEGSPVSITFIGKLFDEGTVLVAAKGYQDATDFHTKHPPLFP